jgi:hypothetical protein
MLRVLFIALTFTCIGCAGAKRAQPFNETALAPYGPAGEGRFHGHVQFDYLGVHALIDKDSIVCLTPVTDYTAEWYTREIIGGQTLEPADPRLKNFQRFTTINSDGDYHFDNLPPGEYYITGNVHLDDPFRGNYVEDQPINSRITIDPPRYFLTTPPRQPRGPAPSATQEASPSRFHL